MMIIENKFEIGDMVYLKTDPDQLIQIIVAIHVFKSGELMYKIASGSEVSIHYEFELSDTINEQLKIDNL